MTENQSVAPYQVGGVLPSGLLEEISPGTNLLVSAPSMIGRRQFLYRALARGGPNDEGAVIITARNSGSNVVEAYQDLVGEESFFRVIDCTGSGIQSEASSSDSPESIRSLNSPADLTGIGIAFGEISQEARDQGIERLRVGVDSLSTFLMYVDPKRLFRFLHVFTTQIQTNHWLGLFTIDPTAHDQQVVSTVGQLFDGVVDLRLAEDDSTLEGRIRGLNSHSEWLSLPFRP